MRISSPEAKTSLDGIRKVLCVLRPTQVYPLYERLLGGAATKMSSYGMSCIQKLLSWPIRRILQQANPRSMDYMLNIALSYFKERYPDVQVDVLVEPVGWATISAKYRQQVQQVWRSTYTYLRSMDTELLDKLKSQCYDALVLLYADAIGLSWYKTERIVKRLNVFNIIVITGRRRIFVMDAKIQRNLYLRRFSEKTRIFEIISSIGFLMFTTLLLIYDWLTRLMPSRLFRSSKFTKKEEYNQNKAPTLLNKGKTVIRDWWAQNPMTYGDEHGTTIYRSDSGEKMSVQLGDYKFFEQVDETFYSWNKPLHTPEGYFGRIFDYKDYAGKRVLEVGCGMGTMAMNWEKHDALVTALDLNPIAVAQTRRRFELFGLKGQILQTDGESLPFKDGTFDYVYSWGVLHHTPNTKQAIDELYRVLKPGGQVGVMLYHRYSFKYGYLIYFCQGVLHLENQFLTHLQLASRYTDGNMKEGNPYTWPVTKTEVGLLFKCFQGVHVRIFGTDIDSIFDQFIPGGSRLIPRFIRKTYARRWGWSLWITGRKPDECSV